MSTSPSTSPRSVLIAGRYAIRRKLGSGSMGTVYLAHDVASRRPVALKILRQDRRIEEPLLRLQEEFKVISSLRHTLIAQAYDFGYTESGGAPYYTREYIAGVPLPPGPPGAAPPAKFLLPMFHLLDALEYLHCEGILHLDIHPGNLIVAEDQGRGSVLIDFGLVRSLEKPFSPGFGPSFLHLPPELLEGGKLSAAIDLYQVGRLLLYRLAGQDQGKPSLPREIQGWGTRLTLDLERILLKALQAEPARRFSSAAEFRAALEKALGRAGPGRRRAEPQPTLVGRENALEAIERTLREAGAGRPAFLRLAGGSGLGKTRLLAEARLRAQFLGLSPIEARFLPDPGPEPALLGALRGPPPLRGKEVGWLEPISPRFGGSPRERAQRVSEGYFCLDGKPLVLLLDDLDHADRESRILVEALIVEGLRRRKEELSGRGLAVIGTTSSRAEPPGWRGIPVRLLEPLRPAEARRFLLSRMKPAAPAEKLLRTVLALARGSPLRLTRIADDLRSRWERGQGLPPISELPPLFPGDSPRVACDPGKLPAAELRLFEALAVLERAAGPDELAAALGIPPGEARRGLRSLAKAEAVVGRGRGAARLYQPASAGEARRAAEGVGGTRAKDLHARLAAFLEVKLRRKPAGARDLENLSRHLLAAGRRPEGLEAARLAARKLRESSFFERAARLLAECASGEPDPGKRWNLAEEACEILEESGDHQQAIEILEPFCRTREMRLPGRDLVRALRRLGISYHRAGLPLEALRVFADAQRLADSRRDLDELAFMDTELSELHLLRGEYPAAEEACARGLERLRSFPPGDRSRGRMEMMLRASLGHIHLRKLSLVRSREELEAALALSKRWGTRGDRATILHNLAIAENQLNHYAQARGHFLEAERLLLLAGERRNVVKISTNLAVIAAKLGERDQARLHLERASEMLRHYPGDRLRCFEAFSRGTVSVLFGEAEAAVQALEEAADLARRLGDHPLEDFALVYLAEAHLFSGRYLKARSHLRAAAQRLGEAGSALRRVVQSRLTFIRAVMGRRRVEEGDAGGSPRSEALLLEGWNDLFLGLAGLLSGEGSSGTLVGSLAVFRQLRLPAGERFARLALLWEALLAGEAGRVRGCLASMPEVRDDRHHFLRVAEPLARSEACFFLGEWDQCEKHLAIAGSAIVGQPFLELDWRIELLRTRLALRNGDLQEARRHLHRCLHSRDLLLASVPSRAREAFLAHPRFRSLREAAARLEGSPRVAHRTPQFRDAGLYQGMVGRSPCMVRLFQLIERLRDQSLPVLITGETGTGKELVARAIRNRSLRSEGPFQTVHCACLPSELFESELFGHEAGAFTGAEAAQPGLLEELDGGTLLFDEVGQLPLASQSKLLRVLESGTIRRLGSTASRSVDVRFLFTAGADLRRAVEVGGFRADLYYRLSAVEIGLPALRDRREDIGRLALHLLERHAARLDRPVSALEPEAVLLLEGRDWPGNVRELEALLLRAVLQLSFPARIPVQDLRALLPETSPAAPAAPAGDLLDRSLADRRRNLEREYLASLFLSLRGDTREMMRRLGVRSTKLYAWLRDLGLEIRELRKRL